VSGLRGTTKFRALASETTEVLAGRGLDVVPVVVDDLLELGARRVAEQLGITPLTALKYANPEKLAAEIADAAEHGMRGVRPVRDGRTAALPAWTAGRVIAGLGQVVKYAAANGDTEVPGHAADLLTEFGAALLTSHRAATMTVEHGCMIETADLLEQVASRIAAGEWSNCPCGTDHGQATLDAKVAPAMRKDAAFAREVANHSPNRPGPRGAPS
jgi:hypothetical protein